MDPLYLCKQIPDDFFLQCLCIIVQCDLNTEYYITLIWNRENAGLLGLTRVGSRRVVQISAGFMLFFSVLGKPHFYFEPHAAQNTLMFT